MEQIDPSTQDFIFNHTMLRVRDPEVSLKFYTEVLGMKLLRKSDYNEWKFSLYFLGMVKDEKDMPTTNKQVAGRSGVLELTHNHGTENSIETPYHNGNTEPRGFGHICFSVPDIQSACERFIRLGVPFQKKLGEGGMKDIAFIKDPDHYWIEIIQY
ncbi:MAG: lactoylglutathione lyase [Bdellovibrionales bacterium]|nr:lactoylglutathione lyase [Bdellovibrionales bacterium]